MDVDERQPSTSPKSAAWSTNGKVQWSTSTSREVQWSTSTSGKVQSGRTLEKSSSIKRKTIITIIAPRGWLKQYLY